jgi:hypothetical protein
MQETEDISPKECKKAIYFCRRIVRYRFAIKDTFYFIFYFDHYPLWQVNLFIEI